MSCFNWLNLEFEEDIFFIEELKEVRDHILEKREEDISAQLYVFQERIFTYSKKTFPIYKEFYDIVNKKDVLCSWENIGLDIYEYSNDYEGKFSYRINKREVKKCFLLAWTEILLWELMDDEDINSFDNLFSSNKCKNQFIVDEYIEFSYKMMKNYWNKYQKLKPYKRKQKIFLKPPKSITKNNNWKVYVPLILKEYYYSHNKPNKHSNITVFPPLEMKMDIITCQKDTETFNAAIANFISWKLFLKKKEENKVDNILKKIHKSQEDALKDNIPVSDKMKNIIKKINNTGLSSLNDDEKIEFEAAAKTSQKFRLLCHIACNQNMRNKISDRIHKDYIELTRTQRKKPLKKIKELGDQMIENIKDFGDQVMELLEWMSPIWVPQLAGVHVGAADIPEQSHTFIMNYGEINISCLWKPPYKHYPAFIQIKWVAKLIYDCELWIKFYNPEDNTILSEIFLGTHLKGEQILYDKTLNFDPCSESWAISVVLKRKNV